MDPAPTYRDFRERRFATPAGPATNHVSQALGIPLAYLLWRLRVHPNAVTLLGLAFSVSGAFLLATQAGWVAAVGAALLFNVGYALDCADGQVARAARKTSPFGSWLDLCCDAVTWLALGTALAYRMEETVPRAAALLLGLAFGASKVMQMNAGLVVQKAMGKGAVERRRHPVVEAGRFALDTPTTMAALPLATLVPPALAVAVGAYTAGNLLQAAMNVRRIPRAPRPA